MQQPATWDAVAAGYAQETAAYMSLFADAGLAMLAPEPEHRAIDVAAGPGSFAFVAAARVARVLATDFSPAMVEQIRARVARDAVQNVEAEVMDALALAVPDAAFDLAACMFGFMFFPDRARGFRELHRVLRPGGRALVATWAPLERRPFMKIGFDALAEAVPDLPPVQKGDLQHADECVREMSAAGFGDVRVQPFTASVRIASPEHFVGVMERSGAPFAMLKKKLGAEGWAQASARLLEAVRRRIPPTGAELSAEALLTVGTR